MDMECVFARDVPMKHKILLFGRTGCGKSTVGNMMIQGNLTPPLRFPTSSGVRGKTLTFQREESDDWVVVDTVGLGEGEHGTVLDAEARNKLYDFFVRISQESYNFYAYVHKWGKLDELDKRLWDFFKQAFDGADRNYVVIFTHCSLKVLDAHLEQVKIAFPECERFIAVDFPANGRPETSASATSTRKEMVRRSSFKRLQDSLARSVLPPTSVCMRSNLKNGRILLVGTATKARNMVAKLLVDGTCSVSGSGVNGMALNGNDEHESTVLEELEGRRWQVVNALALDPASVGDIYDGSLAKRKAVAAASKLFASTFLTILEHGAYSHLIFVAESGETTPAASKALLEEILKVRKCKSFRTVAVIVSYDGGRVQQKVSNRFKDLRTVCQIQLPKVGTESTEHEVIEREALVALEGTIFQSTPYLFWRPLQGMFRDSWVGGLGWRTFENRWEFINSIANPTAFKVLIYAYVEELQSGSEKKSWNTFLRNLLLKLSKFENGEIDLFVCGYNYRTVQRLPFKHIAAEVACKWDESCLSTKFFRIITRGKRYSLREGLEEAFIWGELQAVDKHHVDKNFARIPLSVGRACSTKINNAEDIWIVGVHGMSAVERAFIENLSWGDAVILWMYPHPNPQVPHEDEFEIDLHFCDICR